MKPNEWGFFALASDYKKRIIKQGFPQKKISMPFLSFPS